MKTLITAVLFALGATASAQQVTASAQQVSGIVVDEHDAPLEFVNVAVLNRADSTFVGGLITDEKGAFTISLVTSKQMLRFSSVGYTTIYINQPKSGFTLKMKTDVRLLGEVTVNGTLPKTRLKGDAMITHIEGSVLEHSGSSVDLLNKLPMVEANEEEISIYGRGTAVVYINGREVKDLKELSRLNSDRIKSVEVIKNPGARYNASVKAVVRIYLKKQQGEGFSVDSETKYRYQYAHGGSENLAMNYRKNGLDIGVTLWGDINTYGKNTDLKQDTYLENLWSQDTETNTRQYKKMYAPTLTLNWQIADNHSVGLRYSYFHAPDESFKDSYIDTEIYKDGRLLEHSFSDPGHTVDTWNHSTNLYYSGKIKDWQIDVNSDFFFSGDCMEGHTRETVNAYETRAVSQIAMDTESRNRNALYAIKATASHPLWGGQLTLGTEDSYTHRTSSYTNTQQMVSDDESEINEEFISAFAEYGRSFGPLYVNAGLRFEHTNNDYYVYGERKDEQCKNYNDWFPSLSLSMPVAMVAKAPVQLSLAYSRNIIRPDYYSLRSNIIYDNKYTLEGGNPLLNPCYNDNLTFSMAWKWFTLSGTYSHVKNQMSLFSEPFSDEHPEVAYLHPIELAPYNQWSVYAAVRPTFILAKTGKGAVSWTPTVYFAAQGQDYKTQTKDGLQCFDSPIPVMGVSAHLQLPYAWFVDFDWKFQGRGETGNIRLLHSAQLMNFNVMKSWAGGKIETRLQVEDAFNQFRQHVCIFNGVRELQERILPTRSLTFSFRYKFNAGRSNYKGSNAGNSQKNRM